MRVGGRQRKEQPDLSALHSFNSLHFTSLMRGIFAPVMEKDFKLVTICCSHTHACTEVVRCGGGASEDGVGVGLEGELALATVCVCVCVRACSPSSTTTPLWIMAIFGDCNSRTNS